jgi:small-conductance mechanosensitive channel
VQFRSILVLLALLVGFRAEDAASQERGDLGLANHTPVYFDARPLFEIRGISALPATDRADLIQGRLRAAAEDPSFDPATIAVTPAGDGLRIGTPGRPLVTVYPADAELEEVAPSVLATAVRDRLAQAIADYRAARTPEGVQSAIRQAVLWTVGFAAAIVALVLVARAALAFIDRHVEGRIEVWEARARNVVRLRAIWDMMRAALRVAFVIVGVLAIYAWLNAVLLALPWTREAGREVLARVSSPVRRIGAGIASAVPDLIALAVIVALTIALLRISRRMFAMVAAGTLRFRNFDPDWAVPTERLVRVLVILFAAIMAYPYVPGSSTEAFKAIGIFAGVLISFGASSIVANLFAGQTLIYRRAFRVGDRISVADVTGDVEEISAQATYIRTPKNERVTIPNAMVLSNQVTNYSHFARDQGLILHTEVGIGYEVAWKDVEAMLLEAARRTPGVLTEPAPFVLQKRLGDYSPVYELNVHTRSARGMIATYSALHACIQDVFAERGMQIMTPSYVADPPDPKVPPRTATARERPPEAGSS